MRNLKKLFAVVMVVAMLASVMVPALAADGFKYEADAKKLYDLGLFNGTSTTSYVPDLGTNLIRETGLALMIRAAGLQDEVEALSAEEVATQLAKIVDADELADWAKPYAAYAVKTGLTNGIDASILPNVKFGAKLPLSGKEYINFMLKAMGYQAAWDDVLTKAAEVGMLSAGEAVTFGTIVELNRDSAVGIMASALTGTTAAGVTLAQALVDAGAVDADAMAEAGFFTPTVAPTEAPVELAVESYSADNLKEITLVFNRPLDKDTVKTDNIRVKKSGVSISGYSVSLKDDKQTVVIKAADGAGFDNQVTYSITLKGVKDSDKVAIKETTIDVKPFDATLPEVVGMKVTGPKDIEIEFSEPIKAYGSVALKTGTTTVGVNSSSFSGVDSKTIKVSLYSNLVDGKTYTVTIKGFKDFAEYQMINYTGDMDYVADKTEIVASIEKVEQTYVVVKFNKPVKGITKDFFYHTFSAWKALDVYTKDTMTDAVKIENSTGAVDKVWVKFAEGSTGYPIPEGSAKLVIRDKVDSAKIKDNWDNEFLGAELILEVSADKTAPSVTELKVDTERALKIKFDEDVKFGTDNVEVLNADGSKNSDVKITVTGSGKEYTIDLGKTFPGKSFLVNIKNVEDKALAPNKLVLHSETLDITDKTKPTISNVTYKEEGNEKALFIFFSESVDDTALNKDNYYILVGSTWTKFSNAPEFYDGNKVVRIELKAEELTKITTSGTKVVVKDVKDLAGNALVVQEFSDIKTYNAEANQPVVAKAEATATNKVVLTFDQYLVDVDASAFTVNGAEPSGMELSTNDKGNTVVTLTTKDDNKFKHDLSDVATVVIDGSADKKLNNIFGVRAKTTVPTIADKIKPEIAKNGIETLDTNADGKIDNIKITFTEAIKFNYVSATTFSVEGYTIEDAYAATTVAGEVYNSRGTSTVGNSDTVMIRVKQKDDLDGTAKPKVKVVTEIQDVVGNKYDTSKDAVAAVDKVAPIVVTKLDAAGTITENKTHKIVFSEALKDTSRTDVKEAVEAAYTKSPADGTATVTFAWSSDNKTLTVTITADATNTVVLGAVADTAVTDAADNTSAVLELQ